MNIAHVNENALSLTPDQIEAKDKAIAIADQIAAKEAECLKTIHSRYCIIKGYQIHISDVKSNAPFTKRPQYREYFYKYGMPDVYFLMSRDVTLDENLQPVLTITFNRELMREGE